MMPAISIARLKILKEEVDRILTHAGVDRAKIQGAINWADLRCVEVASCVADDGEEYLAILIEEAAPDAVNLHSYVWNRLKSLNVLGNIRVATDW